MAINRRNFIRIGSMASAALMVPRFLKGFELNPIDNNTNKILVVVQLSGGNDGLNTVIPYRNDIYYKSRQNISIRAEKALKLNDDLGLHPSMKSFKNLFDEGKLGIVNGVGYPHPNRSHFRSMDIWQTASGAKENWETGWIGRVLDQAEPKENAHNCYAVELDDTLSLALKGDTRKAIAVRDINQYHKAASNNYFKKLATHSGEHQEKLASYLYQTLSEATASADYLFAQSKIYSSTLKYPDTAIGKRMKTIGSLINSGTETRIYYVSHGGFDTHANQMDRQAKQLGQLDEALGTFYEDMKVNKRQDDVMIMVFSEFGRRVAQNASNGTDHGTANSMFFIGGGLKKAGVYNDIPKLDDLDEGDLNYEIDFRQAYATILDNWLEIKSKDILSARFDKLEFV